MEEFPHYTYRWAQEYTEHEKRIRVLIGISIYILIVIMISYLLSGGIL